MFVQFEGERLNLPPITGVSVIASTPSYPHENKNKLINAVAIRELEKFVHRVMRVCPRKNARVVRIKPKCYN